MAKPNPKATMRCGETRKSTRPGKKIMHLYCLKGGKKKLVHAGSTGYARTRVCALLNGADSCPVWCPPL